MQVSAAEEQLRCKPTWLLSDVLGIPPTEKEVNYLEQYSPRSVAGFSGLSPTSYLHTSFRLFIKRLSRRLS